MLNGVAAARSNCDRFVTIAAVGDGGGTHPFTKGAKGWATQDDPYDRLIVVAGSCVELGREDRVGEDTAANSGYGL